MSFFFFQAEDGIRDVAVTGVQTCALPISFPFQRTTDVEMKPVPLTVRVKVAPPAVAPVGEIEDMAGTGFDGIGTGVGRSEEHTSELQSRLHLVCRLLLEKKKATTI